MKHIEYGHTKSLDETVEYCYQQQYCGSGLYIIIRNNNVIVHASMMYNKFGYISFDKNDVIYNEYNVFLERDNILYLCKPWEPYECKNPYIAVLNCIEFNDLDQNDDIHVGIKKHIHKYNSEINNPCKYSPFGKEVTYINKIEISLVEDDIIKRWSNQDKVYIFEHGKFK